MSRPTDREEIAARRARWEHDTRDPHVAAHGERLARVPHPGDALAGAAALHAADLEAIGFDYLRDVGFPGEFPYTRGTEPERLSHRAVAHAQVTGFGTGADWAKRAPLHARTGSQGPDHRVRPADHQRLDSDHPLAAGEVGRAGIAIDSLADMEAALDLPFDKLQHLTSVCNGPQPVNLAMILAALEKRGVDPASFTLQMPNAILIEYTCVGRYIYPPEHGLRIATDVIEYVIRNHPNWVPISVVSAQLYAARANPVQELAFGFSIAMQYLDAVLARGFTIDEVAPYFSFITGVDMDFFEAVGEAARLSQDLGAADEGALRRDEARVAQAPPDGVARHDVAHAAAAAQQHRAARRSRCSPARSAAARQTMTTPLHDEAHALPSEEAIAVGAAIQQHRRARDRRRRHDRPARGLVLRRGDDAQASRTPSSPRSRRSTRMGGALARDRDRLLPARARARAVRAQPRARDGQAQAGRRELTARASEKRSDRALRARLRRERRQIERLRAVRARARRGAVAEALDARARGRRRATRTSCPPILEAVKLYATHGEICDALRDVFGTYTARLAHARGSVSSAGSASADPRAAREARARRPHDRRHGDRAARCATPAWR